jgi:hypothetical protein
MAQVLSIDDLGLLREVCACAISRRHPCPCPPMPVGRPSGAPTASRREIATNRLMRRSSAARSPQLLTTPRRGVGCAGCGWSAPASTGDGGRVAGRQRLSARRVAGDRARRLLHLADRPARQAGAAPVQPAAHHRGYPRRPGLDPVHRHDGRRCPRRGHRHRARPHQADMAPACGVAWLA